MNRARGSWWWAQITRALVYLALGIVSAGLAVWLGSKYSPPIRAGILVLMWVLGASLIDMEIQSAIVEEEGP